MGNTLATSAFSGAALQPAPLLSCCAVCDSEEYLAEKRKRQEARLRKRQQKQQQPAIPKQDDTEELEEAANLDEGATDELTSASMEQTGSGSADVDISGVSEDAASDKSSSSTLTELTSSGSDAADPKHLGSSNTPPTGQSVQGAPQCTESQRSDGACLKPCCDKSSAFGDCSFPSPQHKPSGSKNRKDEAYIKQQALDPDFLPQPSPRRAYQRSTSRANQRCL